MNRFQLTKAALASVVFGLALLLLLVIAATRCGRPVAQAPVVIIDTVRVDTARAQTQKPATRKKKKSKRNKSKSKSTGPAARPYLDQRVDCDDADVE